VKEPCSSDNARQDGEIVKILTIFGCFFCARKNSTNLVDICQNDYFALKDASTPAVGEGVQIVSY
jgi:hypothetical protein